MVGKKGRSGRRKRVRGKPVKTVEGLPQRPKLLSKDEAWCWNNIIAPAKHLGEVDTALAQACCELWGLYRTALRLAKENPEDKDMRCSVTSYYTQWERSITKLGIDPLARERTANKQQPPDEADPLKEFGIVG